MVDRSPDPQAQSYGPAHVFPPRAIFLLPPSSPDAAAPCHHPHAAAGSQARWHRWPSRCAPSSLAFTHTNTDRPHPPWPPPKLLAGPLPSSHSHRRHSSSPVDALPTFLFTVPSACPTHHGRPSLEEAHAAIAAAACRPPLASLPFFLRQSDRAATPPCTPLIDRIACHWIELPMIHRSHPPCRARCSLFITRSIVGCCPNRRHPISPPNAPSHPPHHQAIADLPSHHPSHHRLIHHDPTIISAMAAGLHPPMPHATIGSTHPLPPSRTP